METQLEVKGKNDKELYELARTFMVKLKDVNGADPVKSKRRAFQVKGAPSNVWNRKKCGVSQELPLDGAVA